MSRYNNNLINTVLNLSNSKDWGYSGRGVEYSFLFRG